MDGWLLGWLDGWMLACILFPLFAFSIYLECFRFSQVFHFFFSSRSTTNATSKKMENIRNFFWLSLLKKKSKFKTFWIYILRHDTDAKEFLLKVSNKFNILVWSINNTPYSGTKLKINLHRNSKYENYLWSWDIKR